MLRRLIPGLFIALVCSAAIAACSTNTTVPSSGGVPGVGPNPAANTVYAGNTALDEVQLFAPSPGPSSTPEYAIGGSSTALNGPQYLAFDGAKMLYVTNYNAATQTGLLTIYKTYALGNVLPVGELGVSSGMTQPHGIAIIPSTGQIAVANTDPTGYFQNQLLILAPFTLSGGTFLEDNVAGTNTQLQNPSGVAVDSHDNVWVTNRASGTLTAYVIPTPSPTPTPTATPSATPSTSPSPSPTPTGPTPTPSPTPTPFSVDIAPASSIGGAATDLGAPAGIALDPQNDLFVADPAAKVGPAILVFDAGATGNVPPSRIITSSALVNPTDVKVDSSGTVYVVDQGNGANTSKILIFAPGANGNTSPSATIPIATGTLTGMALSP